MEPESPFDPLSEELSETTRRPTSPFSHDPEPRLGIVHLMGWTGFTAAIMGLQQLFLNSVSRGLESPGIVTLRVAWGLGAGIAIGSLLMMAVRRWRRIVFPVHPGEYVLVLHGLSILVMQIATGTAIAIGKTDNLALTFAVPQVVLIFLTIWAWRKCRQRHWRAFFLSFAVLTALLLTISFGQWLPFRVPGWMWKCIPMAVPCTLVIAVLGDKRLGKRRPWTHWLGIALGGWLWFTEWVLPLLIPLG